MKGQYFVGRIEKELNGYVKVEGYLFDTQAQARDFMGHWLKRAVYRILTLVLGRFQAQESQNSREPGRSRIPPTLPMR